MLFADLVGSTELGEQDPERTRVLLERFYDAMAEEVELAGGTVEKFAGDAVMAAFGAPLALEDHAERALHAALAMRRRIAVEFAGLELRIGVNTGEVVVGQPREGSSFVTGDPVNVCARLEQASAPGEVLAGERTVAAARGAFEFAEPRTIAAKGKRERVPCRRVERALTLMRPRDGAGARAAFVGREAELAAVRTAYGRAAERGEPHLLTILGEPGVGKTRLARELWDWLAAQSPQPVRRTGRCLSYGRGTTYWPIGEILREHLGLGANEPPELVRERLGERRILGLALGLDEAAGLHPLVARERLEEAWLDLVGELTADRPAVLLVEDIHWAEDDLLELLATTLERSRGPLLLVCTARPELLEQRPGWGGARRGAATIELDPLDAPDAERLLAGLLGGADAGELLTRLVERAAGNPFFLEELLSTVVDRGLLVREDGRWRVAGAVEELDVPDSVRGVVAARIDLLPAEGKTALGAASVIGRSFWPAPVRELAHEAVTDLGVLVERDFVRRRAGSSIPGEAEYVFRHQLTREVAYASLPKRTRGRFHAAFATWLERFGRGRDEDASLLAHHYSQAVRPDDADLVWGDEPRELERLRPLAVTWLRRAGVLATARFELAEAVALLEDALALEPDGRGRAEILHELAAAHIVAYDVERLRAGLEEALALAPDDRQLAAEAYSLLGLYGRGRHYMWRQPPPRELGDEWVRRALELAAPETAARGRALVARTLVDPSGGAAGAEEALAIAERLGDLGLVNVAIEARSLVASTQGAFDEAAAFMDGAIELVQRLERLPFAGGELMHAIFVFLRAGRIADAGRYVAQLEAWAPTPHDAVHAAGTRALLLGATADWAGLAAHARRAERAAAANGETPCQFNWRAPLLCALGHAHAGDADEATRLEESARESAVVAGPAEREPALLRLALLRGDLQEAERILELLPRAPGQWDVETPTARLEAYVALGDRAAVEAEALPLAERPSYYRPFALRALGVVREDAELLRQAEVELVALGLERHVSATRATGRRDPSDTIERRTR